MISQFPTLTFFSGEFIAFRSWTTPPSEKSPGGSVTLTVVGDRGKPGFLFRQRVAAVPEPSDFDVFPSGIVTGQGHEPADTVLFVGRQRHPSPRSKIAPFPVRSW